MHCSEETGDDRANALLPKTSELPNYGGSKRTQPTWQKYTLIPILVKNKYFKISKLCKHVPLLLFNSMHMDYLQIEKYRLAFCSGVFFLPSPLKCLCPFAISLSTFNHPDKDLITYCRHGQDN